MNCNLKDNVFENLDVFQINEFINEYGTKALPGINLSREEYFKEIEIALTIKLNEDQKLYLTDPDADPPNRYIERIQARCIKLALTYGKPIWINFCGSVLDSYLRDEKKILHVPDNSSRYYSYENRTFIMIHSRLKEYGFEVSEINNR
jgi:hypothetical protein